MQNTTIIFDLDNTLIKTGEVYRSVFNEIVSLLSVAGLPVTDVRERFHPIEESYVKTLGFKRERFPLSLVALYEHLAAEAALEIDEDLKEAVYTKALSVYTADYDLIECAADLLSALKYAGYRLMVVTKGDDDIQRDKIRRAGIEHYFDHIVVLGNKTKKTWEFVAAAYNVEPSKSFVIGDSIKSDVNPAIAAGFNAVYIKTPEQWYIEFDDPHPNMIPQKSLRSLVNFFQIQSIFKQERSYRRKPEKNLLRAVLDGYAVMTPHPTLKKSMPHCPGTPYLITFSQDGYQTLKEVHAVFSVDEVLQLKEELSRKVIHWEEEKPDPAVIKSKHAKLPPKLCSQCKNRTSCESKRIFNGVKL